jgi:hypothetical protein
MTTNSTTSPRRSTHLTTFREVTARAFGPIYGPISGRPLRLELADKVWRSGR